MVGVENPGFCSTKDSGEGENLMGAKPGKRMEAEFLSRGGERSIDWAGHFDRPAQMRQTLGKSEALGVGAAPLKSGVKLKNSGGKGGGRHGSESRGNKPVVTSRGREKDFQIWNRAFRSGR